MTNLRTATLTCHYLKVVLRTTESVSGVHIKTLSQEKVESNIIDNKTFILSKRFIMNLE